MMSLSLVVFGIIGLTRLPVRELPDIDPPIINVQTVYPGASAAVMETQITEQLEDALMSVEGIRTITSESREQVSSITIEFNLARDIDIVAQDVRDRVSRVRGKLPDEIDEPIVAKQDSDASPVLWVAVYSDRYSTLELTNIAEDFFKDRLQTINGVSSVIFGGQKRFAIRLRLDAPKMASRGVTVLDIEAALKRENVELPSGLIENIERSLSIETRGQMKKPEEYNNLIVKRSGEAVVRFGDIGQAVIGVEDEHSVARFNSKPCLGIGIIKQSKANTIDVVEQVKKTVHSLMPSLPQGVETSFPYDESDYVKKSIIEVWETLLIAFALVVFTIFIFLQNLRSTFVPAVAIPVSIISTFGVLYAIGYSINIVTMLGLVLAIGLVVDDAIIVLENIYRHIEDGMEPRAAAVKGMKEIGFVVIATTVTLVCVFMPMAFQTSITGRLFIEFAVAISASVLISAFVALTLTPTLSARILKPHASGRSSKGMMAALERFFTNLTKRYTRSLTWSMKYPAFIAFIAAAAMVLTWFFYTRLDHEFVPLEDKGRFLIFGLAPEGSTTEYTDRMVRKMEKIVSETPETQEYFSAVALAFAGPGKPEQGLAFIRLKEDRTRHLRDIINSPTGLAGQLFTQVQGAFAIPIIPKSFGGGFTQPFELVIQAQDLIALNNYAEGLVNKLRQAGFLLNVRSNFELNKPELRLSIDRDRAAQLGVTVEDIAKTLQIAFGGLDLSKVNIKGKQYDVIAQLLREQRLTPADVENLYVRSSSGGLVQLSNLIDHQVGAGPSAINHYNRMRSAIIEATPTGMSLGTVMEKVEVILKEDLPAGFRYEWKGEAKDLIESSQGIYFVMVLALVVIYIVLAAQFESLIHPLTVMLTLPLAAFGAFGALWLVSLFNIPSMGVNLYSQIGLILLFGLVTKNAILLVDFANQQRALGKNAVEAMLVSGAVRLRPILMTAAATIAGILPIAIGFGGSGEARRSMGVTAVGGMLTSTFLTLFVIPIVYVFFSRLLERRRKVPAITVQGTLTALLILAVAATAGCSAKTANVVQNIHLPPHWKNSSAAVQPGLKPSGSWWQAFEEPYLSGLIEETLKNNQDLKQAVATLLKARAVSRQNASDLLPTLEANPEFTRERLSRNSSLFFDKSITTNTFSLPLDLSYEIDLWGKARQALAGKRLEASEQEELAYWLAVSLSIEAAQNYWQVRTLDEQIAILQTTKTLRQQVGKILSARHSSGLTSSLVVSQAQSELDKVEASLVDYKRHRALAENALALILGKTADQLDVPPDPSYVFPIVQVPVQVSSDVLRQRSDIGAARYALEAAAKRVGVARAAFWPSITLGGSAGFSSMKWDNLFSGHSAAGSAGPQINVPILNGGLNRARLQEAKADYELKAAAYKQTVLTAFKEVEDALTEVNASYRALHAAEQVLASSQKTFDLSKGRYDQGLVSYLDVVDAQRALLDAELALTENKAQVPIAATGLIKAQGTQIFHDKSR